MPPVTFDHVVKRFGDVTIIEDFHLDVADGEFLVLVGGSGSGKSTLLRILAGLETATSGRVLIGDREVTALPPRDRDVAMVFQDYALYPHMTVRENLSLGLRLRKTAPAETERRVAWAAGLLGLDAMLERKPKQLSGGQRQRVAMGRAIVREPQVYLFDEPLSNLDAGLRGQMRMEIGALQRRLRTTTIYVTHDQVEATTLGHRIVVLAQGRIQQVGTPMELYRSPVNRFVAGFIGTPAMNFIDGRLEVSADAAAFVTDGARVALSARRVSDGRAGAVTLGVRPEDLRLQPERSTSGGADGALCGTVVLVERLGGTSHVHVEVGATRLLASVTGDDLPEIGAPVVLDPRADRLHLFDGQGAAIAVT